MGDNQARWDHLHVSIPMANGFGVSGQPFVGADVGGFQGDSNGELFVRWMQYGALTPFCRNHSMIGNVDQYAWAWGEAILDLARAALELRYRLLPYLYAAFVRATETGEPVQRPLVFDHQDDAIVRDIEDEYLLGRDLLVAPVTEPGMTARQVYLPRGEWYDWHSGERHAGGRWVVAETPMDRIPIYVRAGAVIPMWPQAPASTAGHHPEEIELHVFPGSGESLLVEDDGLTATGGPCAPPSRSTAGSCARRSRATATTRSRAGG
jgi:alpha-glucosidase